MNLNELELDDIADWPIGAQSLVIIIMSILLSVVGYWYFLIPKQHDLDRLIRQESDLRTQVVQRANQVSALLIVRTQLDELSLRYESVLKQLPVESELANLLADINDIGVSNGLEFQRIEWAPRIEHKLYYELPIQLKLTGTYEQIGAFSAQIAKLSRIVTLNDFKLNVIKQVDDNVILSLSVSARTYRFKSMGDIG